jgi:MFS superfamily sulfate permease-like transporter
MHGRRVLRADSLHDLCDELTAKGTSVAVAGAHAPVRGMLERCGLVARIGQEQCFATLDAAVAVLAEAVEGGEQDR